MEALALVSPVLMHLIADQSGDSVDRARTTVTQRQLGKRMAARRLHPLHLHNVLQSSSRSPSATAHDQVTCSCSGQRSRLERPQITSCDLGSRHTFVLCKSPP